MPKQLIPYTRLLGTGDFEEGFIEVDTDPKPSTGEQIARGFMEVLCSIAHVVELAGSIFMEGMADYYRAKEAEEAEREKVISFPHNDV